MNNAVNLIKVSDECDRLRKEADHLWKQTIERFISLIPSELEFFAEEKGWISGDPYTLARDLGLCVIFSKSGHKHSFRLTLEQVVNYGFRGHEDATLKFATLTELWGGSIVFDVCKGEDYGMVIYYYTIKDTSAKK